MRFPIVKLIISGIVLAVGAMPAQAQVSENQVAALVEALRIAAPQTGRVDDGLYSDWQIMPNNIPRWSSSCIGQELSPAEFEAQPEVARSVVACVMGDVMREEYTASNSDEMLAVRRAAAWWMRGDPNQYDSPEIADYIQRVVSAYEPQATAEVDWAEVTRNAVGDRFLVERNSIDYRDGIVWYWEQRDFPQPNNAFAGVELAQPVHSAMLYQSGDCVGGVSRLRQIIVRDNEQQVIERINYGDAGPLTQPQPGSSAAAVLGFVCEQAQSSSTVQ